MADGGGGFNFLEPDYASVFRRRFELLQVLRADPAMMAAFKTHYANNIADFINDWGVTFDPRYLNDPLRPALMPFVLFPRQRDCVDFIVRKWREGKPGLIEKSRDVGLSWIVVSVGVALGLFNDGFVGGYGSRKEEYVDKSDSPKSLFWKARFFLRHLPAEFRAGWIEKAHAPHMRCTLPNTGSYLAGEAGDGIGRGDRTSLYFVDEAAHLERDELIEASLSATTLCRIDLSSVKGTTNAFYRKRMSGKIEVFVFDWRDDPRKDQAWYDEQCELLDPVTVSQEIDRNYNASVEGIVIPNAWVQAAIDAHVKLGIEPTGNRRGALDVADEGKDLNGFAGRQGIMLDHLEEWRGVGSDIFATVERAFRICDESDYEGFEYDSDGLGAGARGDARVINERREANNQRKVSTEAFRGSEGVIDPDGSIPYATAQPVSRDKQVTNKNYFANRKAQAWWSLRVRFQRTYRAVTNGDKYSPDDLISISSQLPELAKLTNELSQPTYSINGAGKVLINKAPDGTKSPNLADSVMMVYSPAKKRRGFFSQ